MSADSLLDLVHCVKRKGERVVHRIAPVTIVNKKVVANFTRCGAAFNGSDGDVVTLSVPTCRDCAQVTA